ncbi:MAG: hypothetical protein HZB82_03045 [Deltaproteobacteria bacterium]|nr:hypothetical protein [Deltaproteobacteria bacterium]
MSYNVYEIAALMAAISVSALAIAAIPAVLQIKRTIRAVEDLSLETKKSVETLNGILKRIDCGVAVFEETAARFKQTGERISDVIDSFMENIKKPIAVVAGVLSSIEYAFKLFFGKERKKGGVQNDE